MHAAPCQHHLHSVPRQKVWPEGSLVKEDSLAYKRALVCGGKGSAKELSLWSEVAAWMNMATCRTGPAEQARAVEEQLAKATKDE